MSPWTNYMGGEPCHYCHHRLSVCVHSNTSIHHIQCVVGKESLVWSISDLMIFIATKVDTCGMFQVNELNMIN